MDFCRHNECVESPEWSVMRWTAAVLCNSSPPVLPTDRPAVGPGTLGLEILLPPAQSTSDVYRGTVG